MYVSVGEASSINLHTVVIVCVCVCVCVHLIPHHASPMLLAG